MANPVLEKELGKRAGIASADTARQTGLPERFRRAEAGPTMTVDGTMRVTGLMFLILVVAAGFGWALIDPQAGILRGGGWVLAALFGGLALAIVTAFVPKIARFTAPVYAAAQGLVLGFLSRIYESAYQGIVVQAILATGLVFVVMLVLYATRTIRVTERVRSVIVGATVAILLFYGLSLVLMFFDVGIPLVWDSGPVGILFSLVVVGVAAFNLLLDFDLIERGSRAGLPGYMDWYAAFGLMVTIVWLYLEMLRLLSKVRSR
ncbi:MAG: Bax inhibitor-1/YccA family protein [Acidimicrobiia bacterium]